MSKHGSMGVFEFAVGQMIEKAPILIGVLFISLFSLPFTIVIEDTIDVSGEVEYDISAMGLVGIVNVKFESTGPAIFKLFPIDSVGIGKKSVKYYNEIKLNTSEVDMIVFYNYSPLNTTVSIRIVCYNYPS